jgi:anti-sigma regulatory factor (Ser/Thr protein kinase)
MKRDFQESIDAVVSGDLFSPVLLPPLFRWSPEWSIRNEQEQFNRGARFRSQERCEEAERKTPKFPSGPPQSSLDAVFQRGTALDERPVDSADGSLQKRVFQLFGRVISGCNAALRAHRDPNVCDGSLERALSDMIRELSPANSAFRAIATGKARVLKPKIHEQVCLIGQEALFNAFRHSQATLIEVEVEYQRRSLRIVIRDNGCGIDPEVVRASRNSYGGLLRMEERARVLGAQFCIWSRLGLGTEVEVSLPFCFTPDSASWLPSR